MDYNYKQYLDTWEEQYDDDEEGEFVYWHYGQQVNVTLPKMTEEQFNNAISSYEVLADEIDLLQKQPDYGKNPELNKKVDDLMAKCFKYELPLFF